MITTKKLKIYQSFRGDIDGFARSGGRYNDEISDEDWILIQNLLTEVYSLDHVRVAADYRSRIEKQLIDVTDSEDTRHLFRKMASEL
jgi:hypothetical protein